MIKDIDIGHAAYFAGIFDGEGSLHFQNSQFRGQMDFAVVTNTNEHLVQWCKTTLEHYGYSPKLYTVTGINKPSYRLKLTAKYEMLEFLRQIQQFVIGKQEKVGLSIELLTLRLSHDYTQHTKYTEQEISYFNI